MIVKCKPTYNFQVVEFEWEVKDDKDLDEMFEWYAKMIQKMIYVSPDQPTMPKIKPIKEENLPKVEEEPASEGQIKFLTNLGLSKEQAKKMNKKEAWEYINSHKK